MTNISRPAPTRPEDIVESTLSIFTAASIQLVVFQVILAFNKFGLPRSFISDDRHLGLSLSSSVEVTPGKLSVQTPTSHLDSFGSRTGMSSGP
jgi:hypothetical protein